MKNFEQEKLRAITPEQINAFKKKHKLTNKQLAQLLDLDHGTIQRYASGTNKAPLIFKYALYGLVHNPLNINFLKKLGGEQQLELANNRNNTNYEEIVCSLRGISLYEMHGMTSHDKSTAEDLEKIKERIEPVGPSRRELEAQRVKQEDADVRAAIEAECGVQPSIPSQVQVQQPPENCAAPVEADTPLTKEQEAERQKLLHEIRAKRKGRVPPPGEEVPEQETDTTRTGVYEEHPALSEPLTDTPPDDGSLERALDHDLSLVDDKGVTFDPAVHAVTKAGKPKKAFGKYWIEKKTV